MSVGFCLLEFAPILYDLPSNDITIVCCSARSQNFEKLLYLHHVSRPSFCQSVRMEQRCSHWTDFYQIFEDISKI